MEHLNYCRSITQQFAPALMSPHVFRGDIEMHQRWKGIIESISNAQKFVLPMGGRIMEDLDFKSLDWKEELKLPFPVIVLEYPMVKAVRPNGPVEPPRIISTRRTVIARESTVVDGTPIISITVLCWADEEKIWYPYPEVVLPVQGYLSRDTLNGKIKMQLGGRQGPDKTTLDSVGQDAASVLFLLNALSCSNVHIQKSPAPKAGKKFKSAYPFDSYHILTVDLPKASSGQPGISGGSHRSPREHLRRGHIRRLVSGVKVWVNAAVIAAGEGVGKITKDYRLREAKPTNAVTATTK